MLSRIITGLLLACTLTPYAQAQTGTLETQAGTGGRSNQLVAVNKSGMAVCGA